MLATPYSGGILARLGSGISNAPRSTSSIASQVWRALVTPDCHDQTSTRFACDIDEFGRPIPKRPMPSRSRRVGQFHRSVHGSGHDDRCQHKHQPMEVPACQAHHWSCTNARRSSARWSRICRRVGPPSAVGWVDIPRRWPGRSTPGAAVSATGRRRRSGAPRWRGDGRGGAAWRRRGRCGCAPTRRGVRHTSPLRAGTATSGSPWSRAPTTPSTRRSPRSPTATSAGSARSNKTARYAAAPRSPTSPTSSTPRTGPPAHASS